MTRVNMTMPWRTMAGPSPPIRKMRTPSTIVVRRTLRWDATNLRFETLVRWSGSNPASPVALSNRCFAKAVLGELEQALTDCNEALRAKPKYRGAYSPRAFVHMKLKRYDAAIAD